MVYLLRNGILITFPFPLIVIKVVIVMLYSHATTVVLDQRKKDFCSFSPDVRRPGKGFMDHDSI